MIPVIAVLIAWILFGGSHLLLSSSPLRAMLNDRLGAIRFVILYTLIAALSFSLLAATIAYYGGGGPPGLNLSTNSAALWILGAIAFVGATLSIAGIVNFSKSPMSVLARRLRASNEARRNTLNAPAGIERITRHPFFVGLALLMSAHVLLASKLAGAVFFLGFALLALIGIPLQDRKLRARHGDEYGTYVAESSAMPFAAMRRSSNEESRPVWPLFLTSIAGAVLLFVLHPLWRFGHGAPFVALVLLGGLYGVARQLRRREGSS